MKIIALFLSLLIAAISLMPCCDFHSEGETHEMASHENSESDHEDFCPPLCTCACCSSSSVIEDAMHLTLASRISVESISPVSLSFIPDYTATPWQPPRLV